MQFFEVVDRRRSIRAFTGSPVEAEKLDAILATARLAPSAGDLQAYQIIVIDEADTKRVLAAAALGQGFVAQAAVVLVFCAAPGRSESKYGHRGASLYCIQDATIAASYAQLGRRQQGLPHAGSARSTRLASLPRCASRPSFARSACCRSAMPPKRRSGRRADRSTPWFIAALVIAPVRPRRL